MPILYKTAVKPYLQELDEYYGKLRALVEGAVPSPDHAAHYGQAPDDFARDCTHIDLDQLNRAIGHFKVSVESLKDLKQKDRHLKRKHAP